MSGVFNKSISPFGSGQTMKIDLKGNKYSDLSLSKNWKRNLKRSHRVETNICKVNSAEEIAGVYEDLSNIKGKSLFFSFEEISNLLHSFKDDIHVYGITSNSSKIHAIRGFIVYKDSATDIFAASDDFARKNYLSYALFWHQINKCKSLSLTNFDFNGVDPENNIGVYNFKKGTGAKLIKIIGEYECSNLGILSKPIFKLIKLIKNNS